MSKKKESIHQKFGKANIQTLVLSIYENRPTKVKTSIVWTKKLHVRNHGATPSPDIEKYPSLRDHKTQTDQHLVAPIAYKRRIRDNKCLQGRAACSRVPE